MTEQVHSGIVELTDRGVLRLTGPETHDFLQGLITNDIDKLSPSSPLYAALLTPQGKFLFDFFIIDFGEALYLDTLADRLPDLFKRLSIYKLRADVTIEDVSAEFAVCAVIGHAASGLADAIGNDNGTAWPLENGVAYIDPRQSMMGFRLLVPKAERDATFIQLAFDQLSEEDYQTHRLRFGMPEGGVDIIPDKAFLLESNFDDLHGVDHQKGCYIGQETTSRTKRRGSVRKRLLPVNALTGEVPPHGSIVKAGDAEIGTVFSGQDARAIATIRIDRWQTALANDTPLISEGITLHVDLPDWVTLPEESDKA